MAASRHLPLVPLFALFEGQPVFRVVDEDLIHLVLRNAPRQHLRHNVPQDVRVAVAAVLGETVLGVDVVRDQHLVLVALLHEERQAEREQRNREKRGALNTTQFTSVKNICQYALMCC